MRIAQRSTIARAECATKKLLLEFFDCAHDLVEVRPIAGVEFGMEKFAIGANLESAAARRNERERLDTFAEFKNFGRQTDGLRRVVSNHAIFDRHLVFHVELLSKIKLSTRRNAVKQCNGGCPSRILLPLRNSSETRKLLEFGWVSRRFFVAGAPIKRASAKAWFRRQN